MGSTIKETDDKTPQAAAATGGNTSSVSREELAKRDYTVMVDKSGSMGETDCPGGKSRWDYAQEQVIAVSRECAKFDDDGIDVLFFNNTAVLERNVTPDKVKELFAKYSPGGTTDTAGALKVVLDEYWAKKAKGSTKHATIVCFTDGQPNDQNAVDNVIVENTKKMDADEQIGISFLQIGKDADARKFLKHLDDELESKGAKFDIVDTKDESEWSALSIEELLVQAITD
jgi:Mg-chelatase subunit ChlD